MDQVSPKNIEYYLDRTSHGSTLSRVVHAWVLARSRRELSWHLFREALESDLSDIQGGTTSEGIHLGAVAGTVDLIQRCYSGLETRGNRLLLNPHLPDEIKELRFNIHYRRQWIHMQLTKDHVRIFSADRDAPSIEIGFQDQVFELDPGVELEFDLAAKVSA